MREYSIVTALVERILESSSVHGKECPSGQRDRELLSVDGSVTNIIYSLQATRAKRGWEGL